MATVTPCPLATASTTAITVRLHAARDPGNAGMRIDPACDAARTPHRSLARPRRCHQANHSRAAASVPSFSSACRPRSRRVLQGALYSIASTAAGGRASTIARLRSRACRPRAHRKRESRSGLRRSGTRAPRCHGIHPADMQIAGLQYQSGLGNAHDSFVGAHPRSAIRCHSRIERAPCVQGTAACP